MLFVKNDRYVELKWSRTIALDVSIQHRGRIMQVMFKWRKEIIKINSRFWLSHHSKTCL